MWWTVCILTVFSVCSTRALEISPEKSVFSQAEGSTFQVNCTGRSTVTWEGNQLPQGAVKAIVENGDTISILTINNVQKSDEGVYRCVEDGKDYSVTLKVFSVIIQNATYEYMQDALLRCSVTDTTRSYTYTWKKGDVDVKDIKVEGQQEYIVNEEDGSLEVKHPPRSFAGLYTCLAKYEEDGKEYTIAIDVPYYATPKVLPFEKSKNLVQDEKLMVECEVLGYPKPEITWLKGTTVIKAGDESRYKLASAKTYDKMSIDNAKLEIDSVDFDDAGEYSCMARNSQWPGFNSTEVILVRVKDKLAALWPFLGIVAEVVILCTIIFIYEKKRNKDAMLDDDDDQDGAAPEKKSDNVRHRGNTNNPRA